MSRDYEAEAREIASALNARVAFSGLATTDFDWPDGARESLINGNYLWRAILGFARQPRGLPAEVPPGHERVRIGLTRMRAITGQMAWRTWTNADGPMEGAQAIVTADVPLPRAVELVGSVEP